jgi:hypothetical protein
MLVGALLPPHLTGPPLLVEADEVRRRARIATAADRGDPGHAHLRNEGPLVRFTTFDDRFILLAPDAFAVTIEPQPEDSEGFLVEFLDAGEEDDPPPAVPN